MNLAWDCPFRLCLATAIHNIKDWTFVLFVKFRTPHLYVFQDWKLIIFLTTGYTSGNKNTEYLL